MKLNVNLATHPQVTRQDPLPLVGVGLLLGTVALAFLLISLVRVNGKIDQIEGSLSQLRAEQADLDRKERNLEGRFEHPSSRITIEESKIINSLIQRKRFSVVELAETLEATLPQQVRLTSVSVRLDEAEPLVHVVALARRERDLLRFLTRLESSEYFRDVLPRTESSTSAETPNEYVSINLTVRYVGGSPRRNGSRRSSP